MLLAAKLIGCIYLVIIYWVRPAQIVAICERLLNYYTSRSPRSVKGDYQVTRMLDRVAQVLSSEVMAGLLSGAHHPSLSARHVAYGTGVPGVAAFWSFPLWGYDHWTEHNVRSFPLIRYLISGLPHVVDVKLQLIKPGASMPVHRLLRNGIVMYHLPLRIQGARTPLLKREDPQVHHPSGHGILIDHTHEYVIRNASANTKVILSMALRRIVGLPRWVRLLNQGVILLITHSGRMQRAIRRQKEKVLELTPFYELTIAN